MNCPSFYSKHKIVFWLCLLDFHIELLKNQRKTFKTQYIFIEWDIYLKRKRVFNQKRNTSRLIQTHDSWDLSTTFHSYYNSIEFSLIYVFHSVFKFNFYENFDFHHKKTWNWFFQIFSIYIRFNWKYSSILTIDKRFSIFLIRDNIFHSNGINGWERWRKTLSKFPDQLSQSVSEKWDR